MQPIPQYKNKQATADSMNMLAGLLGPRPYSPPNPIYPTPTGGVRG